LEIGGGHDAGILGCVLTVLDLSSWRARQRALQDRVDRRLESHRARGLNLLQPARANQIDLNQPGCLRANMDLYNEPDHTFAGASC
jgi:hypothetical protein